MRFSVVFGKQLSWYITKFIYRHVLRLRQIFFLPIPRKSDFAKISYNVLTEQSKVSEVVILKCWTGLYIYTVGAVNEWSTDALRIAGSIPARNK